VRALHGRFAAEHTAGRIAVECDSFANLSAAVAHAGFPPADGILFDLGLSSYHIDRSGRGFSFQRDEPLDMRFGAHDPAPTAADLLESASVEELTRWFRVYGEERFASRIARSIAVRRRAEPLHGTAQLLDIVRASLPGKLRWRAERHAARVFQALRIAVNAELEAVERALPQAFAALAPGGRLAVISFHSLEDRLVKHYFRARAQDGEARLLVKKPVLPTEAEVAANSRAASAKLRALERLPRREPADTDD
jgi:16S rRNA (cytosine1402-N4)-methyltransferase